MSRKCLICKGNIVFHNYASYCEPPETISQCDTCGYTEYYYYYDGYLTYIEIFEFDVNYCQTKRFFEIEKEKDFIDIKKYKKRLIEELKKKNLSIKDLIEKRAKALEFKKKLDEEKRMKVENTSDRWKREDFNEKERKEIEARLQKEISKITSLMDVEVITSLEIKKDEDGYIKDFTFKIDEEKAGSYANEKHLAQKEFTLKNKVPLFVQNNCWSCSRNIYSIKESTFTLFEKEFKTIQEGVSMEKASQSLITGCPYCNRSYVD